MLVNEHVTKCLEHPILKDKFVRKFFFDVLGLSDSTGVIPGTIDLCNRLNYSRTHVDRIVKRLRYKNLWPFHMNKIKSEKDEPDNIKAYFNSRIAAARKAKALNPDETLKDCDIES